MFSIVIWQLKRRVFTYVYVISPYFWKTNNAETEIKKQIKLLKGFKIFVYTSDIRGKMESDCFDNGLKFLWNLSGAQDIMHCRVHY